MVIGLAALSALSLLAADPGWWSQRGVIDEEGRRHDFAACNQGQLKQIATAAFAEIQEKLPGGVGDLTAPEGTGYKLTQLANGWSTPQPDGSRLPVTGSNTRDFNAVNLGQLKAVAKPFYDRLIEIGYTDSYPWTYSASGPNDYAMANIGQVKNLFAFDLSTGDLNHNGIPDWWELENFDRLLLAGDGSADGDADQDGSSNFEEFQRGTDPNEEDSDGDGAPDGADLYPMDANRSEDIPVTQIAVLDISGSSTDAQDVKAVALGDDGHASF